MSASSDNCDRVMRDLENVLRDQRRTRHCRNMGRRPLPSETKNWKQYTYTSALPIDLGTFS